MAPGEAGIRIDEDSLRGLILKAYHELGASQDITREVLEAVRFFLSGPIGGMEVPGSYYFEDDPPAHVWRFLGTLESAVSGLPAAVYGPLLAATEEAKRTEGREIATNVAVFVASVSGPIAVKTGLEETVVGSLVATGLLSLDRVGIEPIRAAFARGRELGWNLQAL